VHGISDAFDVTLVSVIVFLFQFALWYTGLLLVLLFGLLGWMVGWFRRSK
jgi:hypothetical protein